MRPHCNVQCKSCPFLLGDEREEVIDRILEDFGKTVKNFLIRENLEKLNRGLLTDHDIEDIWQLTFTKVWKGFPTKFDCRGDGSLRAWLIGIARNESRQYVRKASRSTWIDRPLTDSAGLTLRKNHIETEVDNRLMVRFLKEEMERHGKIPPGKFKSYWRMFLARYMDGIPSSEIAEAEGCSKEEVEQITRYIRATIRKLGGNLFHTC